MEEEVILLTPESQYNGKGRGWEEHNFVYVSAPSYSIWMAQCCKDASSAQICKNTSDDTPEATLQQSRNLQTSTENYAEQCHSETENSAEQCHSETLSQTDESTTYTLSQESSWSTSLEGQIHLTDGIENLNNTLMSLSGGQVSPIKFQLKTPLREVQSSTRRYLKRKAKEVVHTVLNHLAPGQSSDMFQLLYEDNCHEDTEQSDKTELEITDTILQLYCEAENNALKRQLLSLLSLPNAHSKSKLQKLIPGLTKWEIDQSRAHAASHGAGSLPGPMEPGYRNRMNKEKLEHALSFFLDPKFHQICSYGTKDLHCDNGQTVTIPQVVRTTCHSSLLQMYKSYCSETGFVPLSDSTLYKILSTCSASKRTNLTGLDNIATDGAAAVDDLIKMCDQLKGLGSETNTVANLTTALKSLKMYLKSEYKFSVGLSSGCQDHCLKFALSHPTNVLLQEECDHSHEEICGKCNILNEINSALFNEIQNIRTSDVAEELALTAEKALEKISDWKAHILRTQNQEEGRYRALEELQPHQLLIIMDWAMKFLPALYREKQSDFFGQKGMSWHVSVAIFRAEDGSLKHKTFNHTFRAVRQDWFAVASAIEHILKSIRVQMPGIEEVFLRSDNAGCYHCGCLWLSMHGISERTGISIVRYDFSEPQAGKSYCDAKIAHMRSKLRMFVSSGENVTTPFDMKKAIMDGSGVAGCQCAVVEVDRKNQTMTSHCIKGITNINNLAFEGDDIIAWHSFSIGIGIKIKREDVLKSEQLDTGLIILSDFEEPSKNYGVISHIKNCSVTPTSIFHCSELGCNQQFSSYQILQEHILLDRHVQEKTSTYDALRHHWSELCNSNLFISKQLVQIGRDHHTLVKNSSVEKLQQRWALKKTRKFARFSSKAKDFLHRVFQEGEESGRKAIPVEVSQRMKSLRNSTGEKFFNPDEWLQPSQINSFFSRLSLNAKAKDIKDEPEEDDHLREILQSIYEEEERDSIRDAMTLELDSPI
uniref:C2H2-type domain-containing protein n=1 Tax=Magallana gigas TaxID=29159 RepID=A0A8W8NIJ4_MAGGI